MGRKNKYETHIQPYLEQIQEWYETQSEEQIAKKLGVATSTFTIYKRQHPELRNALKNGRQALIEDLKVSLKKKAKGFVYEETKTIIKKEGDKEIQMIEKYKRYSPPDTGAAHLLLKNLDPTWHNDDMPTLEIKRKELEIRERRLEQDEW